MVMMVRSEQRVTLQTKSAQYVELIASINKCHAVRILNITQRSMEHTDTAVLIRHHSTATVTSVTLNLQEMKKQGCLYELKLMGFFAQTGQDSYSLMTQY